MKQCLRNGTNERKAAGTIRSLVNACYLQFECARVLHETMLVSVLMYGSETILGKGKDRSRIRSVQMENLRGLLDIRRMDKVWIRELCGVTKGLDETISSSSAMWREWRLIGLLKVLI